MAKFVYNNAKNINFSYTLFELNCSYHSWIFYKKNIDLYSKSKLVDELLA